jgi:hypothetical protein
VPHSDRGTGKVVGTVPGTNNVCLDTGEIAMSQTKTLLSLASDKIKDEVKKLFGEDRVGMNWLSRTKDLMYVGVKDLTADDKARWTYPNTMLVATKYSYADMEAQQQQVIGVLGTNKERGWGVGFSMEGEEADAHVILAVHGQITPEEVEKLKKVIAADTLRVTIGEGGGF